jgi:hypothetical protein
MNTNQVGNTSQILVTAEFVKRGIPVCIPYGDNERYDLVVDIYNKLYKIQIKTGRYQNGFVRFKASSSHFHRGKSGVMSYKGQIDYFAVYCPQLNTFYLIHVEEATNSTTSLRVEPTKNNQLEGIRWATDYEFEKVVNKLALVVQ